jgi:two-component system, OmpR family, sensor histidine kinase KdpD
MMSVPEDIDLAVLTELEKLRNELLANISQSRFSPGDSLKRLASALLQQNMKWSDKERKEFLDSIGREAERLKNLVTESIGFNQLRSGELNLEKSRCEVPDIISNIASQLEVLTRHHRLHLQVQPRLPPVHVDPKRIGQVIVSLTRTAVEYSKEGSPVTVEAKSHQREVIFSIIDSGVGIPRQLCDKVFNRAYQVENMIHGQQNRDHWGLSVCRCIVEAHQGKIWVASQIGEGSHFNFSVPIWEGPNPDEFSRNSKTPVNNSSQTK